MYMKLLPSISFTGGADPASFAAITCEGAWWQGYEVAGWVGDAADRREKTHGATARAAHVARASKDFAQARCPVRTCIRNVFAADSETSSLRRGRGGGAQPLVCARDGAQAAALRAP